ncbi:DNA replication regulator Dpb11p [Monosporozyma servazzii]
MSSSKKPFRGISFSTTGFANENDRTAISNCIIKLGGNVTSELIKENHVLVSGQYDRRNTRKYIFSVRHRPDIIFLDSKIIIELYELWKSGEDITERNRFKEYSDTKVRMLYILKNQYADLPLSNCYIFIGRLSSSTGHTIPELEEICTTLGCKYVDSKTLNTNVLSERDQYNIIFISDGSTPGARQNAAAKFHIPIVHYKWLLDCKKRYAMLSYDPYYFIDNVTNCSYDDIGIDACDCWDTLDKIQNFEIEEEENQKAIQPSLLLNKFKPQGGKIWDKVMSKPSTITERRISQDKNIPTTNSDTLQTTSYDDARSSYPGLIFNDCSFIINSQFPPRHQRILLSVIKKNGGTIITSMHTEPDYLILPSNVPVDTLDILPMKTNSNTLVVTEFFIERCLHYKTLINPPDTWSKPFYYTDNFHLVPDPKIIHDRNENTHSLTLAITGFQGVELLHLTKILKLLENKGIKYTEYVNKSIDLLLLNIAALASISENYILWTNIYSDLFQLNKQYFRKDTETQATVFKNSLKRKLGFVKQVGTIPVATPGFIMDIFRKTKHFVYSQDQSNRSIQINDTDWCIICPRSDSGNYEIKIMKGTHSINEKAITSPAKEEIKQSRAVSSESRSVNIAKTIYNDINQTKHSSTHSSQRSAKTNFRETAKEVMSKFQEPRRVSQIKRNPHGESPRLDNIPNLSRSSSKLESNIEVTNLNTKRPKLENAAMNPIERSSSWGTIMSSSQHKQNTKDDPSDTSISMSDKEETTAMLTQIVYGNESDRLRKDDIKHKALTRHRSKQLEL